MRHTSSLSVPRTMQIEESEDQKRNILVVASFSYCAVLRHCEVSKPPNGGQVHVEILHVFDITSRHSKTT